MTNPEVSLLAAVFKGGRHAARQAGEHVNDSHFSTPLRQRIWRTLVETVEEHGRVDPVVLADRFAPDNQSLPVDLLTYDADPVLTVQYAQAVARASRDRKVRELAEQLQADPSQAGRIAAELDSASVSTSRFDVLDAGQIEQIDPPEWLVEDIAEASLVLLYGPSEAGKTFVAVDIAYSVVSGRKWFTKEVRQSPAVYVAGEGKHSFGMRQRAWRIDRNRSPEGMHLIPHPVNLRNPADASELSAVVASTKARLLVVDTWSRCTPGADENSRQDTSQAVSALDRIRLRHECAVMVVHHTGHDETRPRGSTDLYASADTSIRVTPTPSNGVRLACDKQKNAPHFTPWRLSLKPVADSVVLSTGREERQTRGFAV